MFTTSGVGYMFLPPQVLFPLQHVRGNYPRLYAALQELSVVHNQQVHSGMAGSSGLVHSGMAGSGGVTECIHKALSMFRKHAQCTQQVGLAKYCQTCLKWPINGWSKWSYDNHFLTVHGPLLGKQHITFSGWCSASFNLYCNWKSLFCPMAFSPKFLPNLQEITKVNMAEHYLEILLFCLPYKELCTFNKWWT